MQQKHCKLLQKTIIAALAALTCMAAQSAEPTPAQSTETPTEQPAMLQALNEMRAQGCGGKTTHAAALRYDPRLSAAAANVAAGATLVEALKASTYRSTRTTLIALSDFTSAHGAAIHACGSLMNVEYKESGFFARGSQAWIVLAVPFAPPGAAEAEQIEARILTLVNQARGQSRMCGSQTLAAAQPVQLNARLRKVSAGHADEMARLNYFGHAGSDGMHVFDRASRTGYAWHAIGENIASGQMQAEVAVQDWLKSPSHCANLMMPGYTEMGLAFAVNPQSEGGVYWVQVFGLPK